MAYLDRIAAANGGALHGFIPFFIGGQRVGAVRPAFAERLRRWPDVFRLTPDTLYLAQALERSSVAQRSAAVAEVTAALREQGEFGDRWWDEPFAVNAAFHLPAELLLERAALQHFGVCGYGVHLSGFVRAAGGVKLWVAKRAAHKASAPGKLDQLVAGGQPAGLSLRENMIKECAEEAGIERALAERMRPVGAIRYCLETPEGLRPDILYNFDLELPEDFAPDNVDGEVEAFYLWTIEQVIATVRDSEQFKFNCALVVIDFLIRHGFIEPEHPDYLKLQTGLRREL